MEENKDIDDIKKFQQEHKMGFFKKLWYSITKIDKYPEMTTLGLGNSIKYLLILMAIFSIVLCCGLTLKTYFVINDAIEYFEKEFSDVSYKDGILKVNSENVIRFDDNNSIFGNTIIDTNTDDEAVINSYKDEINTKDSGIIILKNEIIVKNQALAESKTYKYDELLNSAGANVNEITKQDILDFAKGDEIASLYTVFFIIMFIYTFILYFTSVIMDTLILAIIGYLTAIIAKIKMRFIPVYNMAVYSLTLSIILNLIYTTVNIFTTFNIKYFQVMYTSVAFIYLTAAIFIIKSDFIKKQAELIKIVEERKKVREEMDKQKEEEKERENKDTDKKDEDNKDDKKEDKKQEDGDNNTDGPEGSEA